jgi:hypothetical protein
MIKDNSVFKIDKNTLLAEDTGISASQLSVYKEKLYYSKDQALYTEDGQLLTNNKPWTRFYISDEAVFLDTSFVGPVLRYNRKTGVFSECQTRQFPVVDQNGKVSLMTAVDEISADENIETVYRLDYNGTDHDIITGFYGYSFFGEGFCLYGGSIYFENNKVICSKDLSSDDKCKELASGYIIALAYGNIYYQDEKTLVKMSLLSGEKVLYDGIFTGDYSDDAEHEIFIDSYKDIIYKIDRDTLSVEIIK